MNNPAALLRAIIARPDDDLPRLTYADWLDEQGQGERAEFIRVQCEMAGKCGCKSMICDVCKRLVDLRRRERELLCGVGFERSNWRHWFPFAPPLLGSGQPFDHRFVCRRGFVPEITCSWQDWLTHHAALLAACPIRNAKDGLVRLTTWPVFSTDTGWPHFATGAGYSYEHNPGQLGAMMASEWPGVRFDFSRYQGGVDWAAPTTGEVIAHSRRHMRLMLGFPVPTDPTPD